MLFLSAGMDIFKEYLIGMSLHRGNSANFL